MTGPEMNATGVNFGKAASGAAAVALLALGGCVSLSPETDPASPAAARVDALVEANRGYPDWADFPGAPRPTPEPAQIGRQVAQLNASGGSVTAEAAAMDWTLSDPEVMGAALRARLNAEYAAPAALDAAARIEVIAEEMRRRVQPPPQLTRPAPRR